MSNLYSEYRLGTHLARYQLDEKTGHLGLLLLPAAKASQVVPRRSHLGGVAVDSYAKSQKTQFVAWSVDSLVQVKTTAEDSSPAFAHGRTLRNSGTLDGVLLSNIPVLGTRSCGERVSSTEGECLIMAEA